MNEHPADVLATLMDPTVLPDLEQRVRTEIDEAVDRAMASSRTSPIRDWLRYWWLAGAQDGEVASVAHLAVRTRRDSRNTVRVAATDCPALTAVLCLHHETRGDRAGDRKSLWFQHRLLHEAIALAIEDAWARAVLSSDERRELIASLGYPARTPELDIWVEHWWTGKGEPAR